MTFKLRILPRAERDAQHIFDWIKDRTPDGARRWWDAFLKEANRSALHPQRYPTAPENEMTSYELRQFLFKTRRGHRYRILFTIRKTTAIILHIRGPGQDLVDPTEIREPD